MSELTASQNIGYTFVSSLFYGLYLSTLFSCIRWLVFSDDGWTFRRRINWPMLSIALVLCLLSTSSKALDLRTGMIETANPIDSRSPGLTKNLLWMDVLSCTDSTAATLLVDGTLIYRCWVIYAKSRLVVAFPIFLWLGGLALTGLQLYCQIAPSAARLETWHVVNTTVGPGTVLMPFWASTIVLNSYTTFMIVRRIYHAVEESTGQSKHAVNQIKHTMRILIESGFLYLAVAIAQFISWWTPNSYAIYIISGVNLTITGIAFNLIIIRAAQNRVEKMEKEEGTAPVSNIQFRTLEVKSCAGQSGVHAQSVSFRNYNEHVDDGNMSSSTASVV